MTLRSFVDVERVISNLLTQLKGLLARPVFDPNDYYSKKDIQDILSGKRSITNINIANQEQQNPIEINNTPEIFLKVTTFQDGVDISGTTRTQNIIPQADNTYDIGQETPTQLGFRWLYVHFIQLFGASLTPERFLRLDLNREVTTNLIDLSDTTDTIDPTGVLPVEVGGTGQSSLTSGSVLVGDGTNPVSLIAGATGTIFLYGPTSNGEIQVVNGVIVSYIDPT